MLRLADCCVARSSLRSAILLSCCFLFLGMPLDKPIRDASFLLCSAKFFGRKVYMGCSGWMMFCFFPYNGSMAGGLPSCSGQLPCWSGASSYSCQRDNAIVDTPKGSQFCSGQLACWTDTSACFCSWGNTVGDIPRGSQSCSGQSASCRNGNVHSMP